MSTTVVHVATYVHHRLEQLLLAQQADVQVNVSRVTQSVALSACLPALVQPHVQSRQSTLSWAAPRASTPLKRTPST